MHDRYSREGVDQDKEKATVIGRMTLVNDVLDMVIEIPGLKRGLTIWQKGSGSERA